MMGKPSERPLVTTVLKMARSGKLKTQYFWPDDYLLCSDFFLVLAEDVLNRGRGIRISILYVDKRKWP
jgi:hypothetical protein